MRAWIIAMIALTWAGLAGAGEPHFTLNLSVRGHRASSPSQEAQQALWNDPMLRLMRAMDEEYGHILVGQPGGRTPPAVVAGYRTGLAPRILSATIDQNLAGSTEPPTAVAWPWSKENEPAAPPMEEQLARLLARRLERRVQSGSSTEGP